MNKRVLSFGEILWDLIDEEAHLGGAPLNFAAHVKKCGCDSAILSCLGNDRLGEKAFDEVGKLGIDTSLIMRRNKKTGLVNVILHNGIPEYEILKPVAYDYIDLGRIDLAVIKTYDVFYFGTLIQRSASSRESLYHLLEGISFKEVFYDVNLRKDSYTQEHIDKSLNFCTILKINDEEIQELSLMFYDEALDNTEFCERLIEARPKIHTVIITAGGEGSFIYHEKKLTHIAPNSVEVADTVGAGDAFSAGFISTLLRTGDVLKSAETASVLGGFVASKSGAIPVYTEELIQLLS
ncbi:MAG: fructokinase [Cyclobacteriaceae bacterium]|jgi:fructokinase